MHEVEKGRWPRRMMQTDDLNLKSQRPLPPLNALRAFDALARCGSLRAAAIELADALADLLPTTRALTVRRAS